jgi:hypothetical protein
MKKYSDYKNNSSRECSIELLWSLNNKKQDTLLQCGRTQMEAAPFAVGGPTLVAISMNFSVETF